jgi:uncharacterized protein YrrD
MLHSAKTMKGAAVSGTDGKVGTVADLYFDDRHWTVRYLVVDTGGWLSGRRVLIPPAAVADGGWKGGTLRLALTQQQIRASPGVDTHQPVSRAHEADIYRHYGFSEYWNGPYLWGQDMLPMMPQPVLLEEAPEESLRRAPENQNPQADEDRHLRSCREVLGYDIRATDDRIGHVDDFLFDEQDWSIRLMVVDTRNWWPGKQVLVAPQSIASVDWDSRMVQVQVTRAELEDSPEYDSMNPPETPPPQPLRQMYRRAQQPPER